MLGPQDATCRLSGAVQVVQTLVFCAVQLTAQPAESSSSGLAKQVVFLVAACTIGVVGPAATLLTVGAATHHVLTPHAGQPTLAVQRRRSPAHGADSALQSQAGTLWADSANGRAVAPSGGHLAPQRAGTHLEVAPPVLHDCTALSRGPEAVNGPTSPSTPSSDFNTTALGMCRPAACSGPVPDLVRGTPPAVDNNEGGASSCQQQALACCARATSHASTSSQTGDELLLWLFACASNATPAGDDLRPEGSSQGGSQAPRASSGSHTVPAAGCGDSGEWGALLSQAGGWRSTAEGSRARAGTGLGKFDSFTSVWSRAPGWTGCAHRTSMGLEDGQAAVESVRSIREKQDEAKHASGGQHTRAAGARASSPARPVLPLRDARQLFQQQQQLQHQAAGTPSSRDSASEYLTAAPSPAPPSTAALRTTLHAPYAAAAPPPSGGAPTSAAASTDERSGQPCGGRGSGCADAAAGPITTNTTGGAAAVLSRTSAAKQRQRPRRCRTLTELSPQRSRVLLGLASGGNKAHALPPPSLDASGLGAEPVQAPSPFSEGSSDERSQQLHALRALRRTHPELAASLDRFASLLQRRSAVLVPQPGSGLGPSHPGAAPARSAWDAEAGHEGDRERYGSARRAGVHGRREQRREGWDVPMRRTHSFTRSGLWGETSLGAALAPRDGGPAGQDEGGAPVTRVLQEAAEAAGRADGAGADDRGRLRGPPPPSRMTSTRAREETEAVEPGQGDRDGQSQAPGSGEADGEGLTDQTAAPGVAAGRKCVPTALAAADDAAAAVASATALAPQGTAPPQVVLEGRSLPSLLSELSTEGHGVGQGPPSTAAGASSRPRFQHTRSSLQLTLGHDCGSGARGSETFSASGETSYRGVGRGTSSSGGGGVPESSLRFWQAGPMGSSHAVMARSHSDGESPSVGAGGNAAAEPPGSEPLSHQAHRRASLLQAWHTMVAQSQQQRRQQLQQGQSPGQRSQAATGGDESSSQSRRCSSSGVPPAHAASASQEPASCGNSRRPTHNTFSASAAAWSSSPGVFPPSFPAPSTSREPRRSDSSNSVVPSLSGTLPDHSGVDLERLAGSPSGSASGNACYPGTASADGRTRSSSSRNALPSSWGASGRAAQAAAVAEGGDERPQRLCKSLSKRSLARLTSSHFRRVSRTKSRFALVKGDTEAQAAGDEGEDNAGTGSAPASMAGTWPGAEGGVAVLALSRRLHGPVVRNMTTGSLAPSLTCGVLENVAEEAEDDMAALTEDRMALAAVHGSRTSLCATVSTGYGSTSGRTPGGRGSSSQFGDAAEAAGMSERVSEDGDACGASRRVSGTSGTDLAVAGGARAAARVRGLRLSDGGRLYRRGVGRSTSELSLAGLCMTRRWSAASPDAALHGSVGQSLAGGRASADSARTAGPLQEADEGLHGWGSASVASDRMLLAVPEPAAAGAQSRWRTSAGGEAGQAAAAGAAVADVPAHCAQGSTGGGGYGEAEEGRRQQEDGKGRGADMSEADADSDEELFEVLSGAVHRKLPLWGAAASGGSSSYFDGDVGQGPADFEAEEASAASSPRRGDARRGLRRAELGSTKSSSFRFAAPVVPPRASPPVAAALPPAVGFAVEEPDELGSPFTAPVSPYGEQHRQRPGVAPAGVVPASPRPPAADEDGFPAPPLGPPVVAERERAHATEHRNTHLLHHQHHHNHRGATEPGSRGDLGPSAGAAAAAGTPAAAGAPGGTGAVAALSARNLLHHTQLLAEPVREVQTQQLVMQMLSPSPSQLGPIDPLSDHEGSTSGPAVIAAVAAAAASNSSSTPGEPAGQSVVVPVSQGLTDSRLSSSSKIASPPHWGQHAAGAGVAPAALKDPLPRALAATRLSLHASPHQQHGIAQHAAAIVAAVAAPANRVITNQLSTNTRKSFGDESLPDADALHAISGDEAPPAAGLSGGRSFALPQGMSQHSYMSRGAVPVMDSQLVQRTSGSGVSAAGMAVMLSTAALSSEVGGGGVALAAGRSVRHAPITSSVLHHGAGTKLLSLGAGLGGDSPEAEVEEAVIANRRLLDERGVLLDEIHIDKVLGFGSMGMVYHGRLYDTRVVVKLIEHGAGVLGKEKERGRLARVEACLSRMLLHPNIVLTYDACTGNVVAGRWAKMGGGGGRGGGGGSLGGRGRRQRCMTVMVQEFCELGTLRDAINKRKHGLDGRPESLPLLYRVALDVANGMKHLASLRIMHADLKAENVLLARAEAGPDRPHGFTAKVADFGLAQVLPPNVDQLRHGIHGTVSHMPPEAMKDTTFSMATDVFSFGVVLWELYTQERPYRGMAPHEVIEAVCVRGERPRWPEGSPPELVALAHECWHTDPDCRPAFAEVVERLRQLLAPTHNPVCRRESTLSGMTEESDELEAALRAQRRQGSIRASGASAAAAAAGASPLSAAAAGGALSEAGSELGGPGGRHLTAMASSGRGVGAWEEGAGGAGSMPKEAPRDPLGLLLWALCQYPADTPARVAGALPDSEQWVLKVEDLVVASREHEAAARAAELAVLGSSSREGRAARRQHSGTQD